MRQRDKRACSGLLFQGRHGHGPDDDFAFPSTALAAGIPIHEVSRWLGHKSITTTVDIYGHLVPEAWDRCRAIMQTVFEPAP